MLSREGTSRYRDLTAIQARTMRADHARLTAFYADRVEHARAGAECGPMAYWTSEYRRSALRCRLLGEVTRGERPRVREFGGERERSSTVVRLAPPQRQIAQPPGRPHEPANLFPDTVIDWAPDEGSNIDDTASYMRDSVHIRRHAVWPCLAGIEARLYARVARQSRNR